MAIPYQLPANLKHQPDHGAVAALDRAAAVQLLKHLGIAPLSPYDSALMTTVKKRIGGWRDSRPAPRRDAALAGELYYFSARPCLRGHLTRRVTSNGACVECRELWHNANADKVRRVSRESQRRIYARKRKAQANL